MSPRAAALVGLLQDLFDPTGLNQLVVDWKPELAPHLPPTGQLSAAAYAAAVAGVLDERDLIGPTLLSRLRTARPGRADVVEARGKEVLSLPGLAAASPTPVCLRVTMEPGYDALDVRVETTVDGQRLRRRARAPSVSSTLLQACAVLRAGPGDPMLAAQIGAALSARLFPEDTSSVFVTALTAAQRDGQPLLVELELDNATQHLPWEICLGPAGGEPLASQAGVWLARRLIRDGVRSLPKKPASPRVLVVVADPAGGEEADAVGSVAGGDSERLDHPDAEALFGRLSDGPWTVVHLLAQADGEHLLLADGQPLDGAALDRLLGAAVSTAVWVSVRPTTTAGPPFAAALARISAPNVLVTERGPSAAPTSAVERWYRVVLGGGSVCDATAQARAALALASTHTLASLVHFSGTDSD